MQSEPCINRNIVECKDGTVTDLVNVSPVLIETLWNVKPDDTDTSDSDEPGINRNIVECKV